VPVLDDGVEQVLEDRVGLLVPSHAAHGHDEGVTWRVGPRSEVLVPSRQARDLGGRASARATRPSAGSGPPSQKRKPGDGLGRKGRERQGQGGLGDKDRAAENISISVFPDHGISA
jgi:hypothetical protein